LIIEDGPEAEEYVIYLLTDKTGKNYVPSLIFVSSQFRQRGLHEEEDKSSESIIWIQYKKLKFDKFFFDLIVSIMTTLSRQNMAIFEFFGGLKG